MASFERHLDFIKRHYTIVTFADLTGFKRRGALPWNCLILTVDDGYEDFFTIGFPLLKRHGLKATLFVVADRVSGGEIRAFWWDRAFYFFRFVLNRDPAADAAGDSDLRSTLIDLLQRFRRDPVDLFKSLNHWTTSEVESLLDQIEDVYQIPQGPLSSANRVLSWQQIEAMRGSVEIGSHSLSHPNLAELGYEDRRREIEMSRKKLIARTNEPVAAFSYPAGITDSRIEADVEAAGYDFAVTTRPGLNDLSNRYSLRRINVWEGTGQSYRGVFSKGFFALKLLGL